MDFTVDIIFTSNSVAHTFYHVKDVYTKDGLLCLSFTVTPIIAKFPLCNIFCINSDYGQR